MTERRPLIYFYGLAQGVYEPLFPCYIVGDRPADLTFEVAVDTAGAPVKQIPPELDVYSVRRAYATATVRSACTSTGFANLFLPLTSKGARSAALHIENCLMRRTFFPTEMKEEGPRFRTGWHCAASTTALSTATSLAWTPITTFIFARIFSRSTTGRCCDMGCRNCTVEV